ncbi:MAG: RNA 2',3'-cyclic phosphodiesterase [Bryobacteraceae bacterium]|nr:RNA 2',3'-cyclic phosphodiesterase [Bryobacteraceae bacterium]
MRLFTGLGIPYEVRRNLELLLAHLKPTADIRWSPPENLHITTKFIGHWNAERLEEVKAALSKVKAESPIQIGISGLGWFPNPRSPRVFWAGVQAPSELAELAEKTEQVLAEIGVPVEKRAFSPHLTLARIPNPEKLQKLKEAVANLPSSDFGTFTADRFILYESQLSPKGSRYSALAQFPFNHR